MPPNKIDPKESDLLREIILCRGLRSFWGASGTHCLVIDFPTAGRSSRSRDSIRSQHEALTTSKLSRKDNNPTCWNHKTIKIINRITFNNHSSNWNIDLSLDFEGPLPLLKIQKRNSSSQTWKEPQTQEELTYY